MRVLYIEDNRVNIALLSAQLAACTDIELDTAEDGQSGLAFAKAWHPDLILLDMHLPDMDGFEVLEALQASELTRRVPVVALSADDAPEDVRRALAAGAKDFWLKPVGLRELREGVVRLASA